MTALLLVMVSWLRTGIERCRKRLSQGAWCSWNAKLIITKEAWSVGNNLVDCLKRWLNQWLIRPLPFLKNERQDCFTMQYVPITILTPSEFRNMRRVFLPFCSGRRLPFSG